MSRIYGLSSVELSNIAEVTLPSAIYSDLCSLAESTASEVCGLMFGAVANEVVKITGVRQCVNEAASPDEFVLGFGTSLAQEVQQTFPLLRMLAIFHSHSSGPPCLSEFDCYFVERTPFVWIVIGRSPSSAWAMRAFASRRRNVEELDLYVE